LLDAGANLITVGIDASPPPPFHTGQPGGGFEVDLLGAIAARVGFSIAYKSALWSEILTQLLEHKLDMICTAATITEDRRTIVDFSRPYFEFELAVVVGRNQAIQSVRDLAGHAVGVRRATTAEEFMRRRGEAKCLRVFDMNAHAYAALQSGELDAVVDDEPIAQAFQKLLRELKVIGTIEGTRMQYGMVFAKGNNQLRTAVDRALGQLEQDGTYAALYRKWFGEQRSGLPTERLE
jgi:polar amino acid transport system substrate-binding protein